MMILQLHQCRAAPPYCTCPRETEASGTGEAQSPVRPRELDADLPRLDRGLVAPGDPEAQGVPAVPSHAGPAGPGDWLGPAPAPVRGGGEADEPASPRCH